MPSWLKFWRRDDKGRRETDKNKSVVFVYKGLRTMEEEREGRKKSKKLSSSRKNQDRRTLKKGRKKDRRYYDEEEDEDHAIADKYLSSPSFTLDKWTFRLSPEGEWRASPKKIRIKGGGRGQDEGEEDADGRDGDFYEKLEQACSTLTKRNNLLRVKNEILVHAIVEKGIESHQLEKNMDKIKRRMMKKQYQFYNCPT